MSSKAAFVTGASRGIGAESAVALARAGFDVVITARTAVEGESHDHVGKFAPLPGSLEATANAVRREGRRALALQADILDETAMLAAAGQALAEFGSIDLLFNNAVYQGDGNLSSIQDIGRSQVDAWLAENEPLDQWWSEEALRGPAMAKQLGLIDKASFLEIPHG